MAFRTRILEVDISPDDEAARDEGIVALPTIEICNDFLVGLPREGAIRDAMLNALMQECFSEEQMMGINQQSTCMVTHKNHYEIG